MKSLFLTFTIALLYQLCTAQSITATIDLVENKFQISSAHTSLFLELNAHLQQDEIWIFYRLPKTDPNQFYRIAMEASLDGTPLVVKPEYLSGAVGKRVFISDRSKLDTIIWSRLTDEYVNLKGTLLIKLTATLERDYECPAIPPTFWTWNDQKKHVLLGAAGVGSIAAGQIFKAQSDKKYDTYKEQKTLDAAQPYYDDANKNHQTYLILTYAGSAILAADLIWEYIHFSKYREDKKDFDRYCKGQNSFSVRPTFIPSGNVNGIGFNLKYQFK